MSDSKMVIPCPGCGGKIPLGLVHACGGRNEVGGICGMHGSYNGPECLDCADLRRLRRRAAANDVRALLWAGMYLAGRCWLARVKIRAEAIQMADEAVADFDEHYLGRAPSTKG